MTNPTTPRTPGGGGRFVGMRRRVYRAVMGKSWCDECGNPFTEDRCPYCAQRRRRGAGLESAVETFGGERLFVTLDRADETDGEGWWPTEVDRLDGDDEPEGWTW